MIDAKSYFLPEAAPMTNSEAIYGPLPRSARPGPAETISHRSPQIVKRSVTILPGGCRLIRVAFGQRR